MEINNFDDLHEYLSKGVADDPVFRAIAQGSASTEKILADVETSLADAEVKCVDDFLAASESLGGLHSEIRTTDEMLEQIELTLSGFQTNLSSISAEIRELQANSMDMNVKLRNRRSAQKVLKEYVNRVVVSPDLVYRICEDEVNESYLNCLEELTQKLEYADSDFASTPAAQQSLPEIERLRAKAVSRIRDFVVNNIDSLKKPKTNLQILQQTVLVKFKFFNVFLRIHHPLVAEEVRQHYVATLRKVYLTQFKTYLTSLSKLQLEYIPNRQDILLSGDSSDVPGTAAAKITSMLGFGKTALPGVTGTALKDKGNLFSLSGRINILSELDKDPLLANIQKAQKYYQEQVFRSHQRLLTETATSEFLFICNFFDEKELELFGEVFGKTLQHFLDTVETFLSTAWDALGILLMIRTVEHYQKHLTTQGIPCLDSYMESLLHMLWPRLKMVLETIGNSVQPEVPLTNVTTHPHYITRRAAELCAALHALKAPIGSVTPDEIVVATLDKLEKRILSFLEAVGDFDEDQRQVFVVNNLDVILAIFHERQLKQEATKAFEDILAQKIGLFVERQLHKNFADLINFVKKGEVDVAAINPSSAQQLCLHFEQNWKPAMDRIHAFVMNSFTNFTNGMEILQQMLTQLLLYYTRYQKLIHKANLSNMSWTKHMVSNATILTEISRYSQAF